VCTDCKGRNHTFDKCPRPAPKVAFKVAPNPTQVAVSAYKAALQTPKPNVPAPNPASSVAVSAYKAALQTPKSNVPASSVAVSASKEASSVAISVYNYEEFSRRPTLNNSCVSAIQTNNSQEPVVQQTLTEYGDQLYILIAEYYPYRAGKITAMFLELDVEEIIELIQNPASLQKRLNEANEILDREYPWGYVDAMFKSICLHTRSSANNSDNIEVQPLDDREEYRKRVYVAHPTWPTSTIDQVVEHFMKKQLSPKEIYNLFSDFERFKVEVNLTFAELNK
jgi:hypothetical protein